MINIGQIITAATEHDHEGHSHGEHDFWGEFLALLTDPAHLAFEVVFTIVFDILIVTVLYGIILKKIVIPRLKKSIHEEIDREHGVEHEHGVGHKNMSKDPPQKSAGSKTS